MEKIYYMDQHVDSQSSSKYNPSTKPHKLSRKKLLSSIEDRSIAISNYQTNCIYGSDLQIWLVETVEKNGWHRSYSKGMPI